MKTLIDLSHEIEHGMVTYKGLPAPVICDFLSREASKSFYEEGTEFQIGRIDMVANTGTYVDCPFHRFADGMDLNDVPLSRFANVPGIVADVRTTENLAIGKDVFTSMDVKGRAVLIMTGWSRHWRTETYFENHPFLTEDAACHLRDAGALLVGIDSHNIDDTRTRRRPVHTTLLGANILIVEHMTNLQALPSSGFTFSAVPPKFKGVGTFPVRAYATVN